MAWASRRRLLKVKVSEMTARQPSVPKRMVMRVLGGGGGGEGGGGGGGGESSDSLLPGDPASCYDEREGTGREPARRAARSGAPVAATEHGITHCKIGR